MYFHGAKVQTYDMALSRNFRKSALQRAHERIHMMFTPPSSRWLIRNNEISGEFAFEPVLACRDATVPS